MNMRPYAWCLLPCLAAACGGYACPTSNTYTDIAGVAVLLLAIGACCWYRCRKGPGSEPPKEQPEAASPREEEATAVAPEAEESPQETLAEEAPPPPPSSLNYR